MRGAWVVALWVVAALWVHSRKGGVRSVVRAPLPEVAPLGYSRLAAQTFLDTLASAQKSDERGEERGRLAVRELRRLRELNNYHASKLLRRESEEPR